MRAVHNIKHLLASPPVHYTVGPVLRRPGVHVLMYHRIGSLDPEFDGLALDAFSDYLHWLSRNATLIRASDMYDPALYKRRGKPAVLLTFDDGYRDFRVNAYPILKKYNAPALVFLPTQAVQQGGTIWPEALSCRLLRVERAGMQVRFLGRLQSQHRACLMQYGKKVATALKAVSNAQRLAFLEDVENTLLTLGIDPTIERQMMTWDEIASTQPLIEYGAHTHSHPIVSSMTNAEFTSDMRTCCDLLERGLGHRPQTFAWPNGRAEDFDEAATNTLRDLGFTQVFTTVEGVNTQPLDTMNIRRLPTTTPDAACLNALMLRAR